MFQIEVYIKELLGLLQDAFGGRLLYLGLQGSYLRNEQNENSDIDIMAVIGHMTVTDMDLYKDALVKAGSYEKSCGFICSGEDLLHWNPLEACHLLHTTKDIYGDLSKLLPPYTAEDTRNFVKLSIGNLYHELCHRYIHAEKEKNTACLPMTYKSVFFILQNLYFLEHGEFYNSKAELLCHLQGEDAEVLSMAMKLQKGAGLAFDAAFLLLFEWCQNTLARLDGQKGNLQ